MTITSNKNTIKELESKFNIIVKNEFEWTTEYINPDDNSKWIKLQLRSEYHGGGYPVMMKKTKISTNSLIKTVLSTKDLELITVASVLLEYFESYEKTEFRTILIENLERHYADKHKCNDELEMKRLELIIANSTIYDDTNRREIVGKNDAEITADYEFFKSIALRTEKLQDLQEL